MVFGKATENSHQSLGESSALQAALDTGQAQQARITVAELHHSCLASGEKPAYLDLFFSFLAFFGERIIYAMSSEHKDLLSKSQDAYLP